MSKKILLLSFLSLLLVGCGNDYNYQVTYQMYQYPDNKGVSLESIKPLLEQRLSKSTATQSAVTIENNQIVVDLNIPTFDLAKSGGLVTPYELTLEEARTELTSTEKEAVNAFNQAQKDFMQQAYTQAKENLANIDAVVNNFSEQINQTAHGVRGPYTKAQTKEDLYWNELQKTEVGQLTAIVEKPDTIWFAKVLEKNGANTIRYQQIIRTLKRPEPYLGHVPVLHLGQYITNAEVVKKDPNSESNKNFAVKVTLNDAGKSALSELTTKYRGQTLRFALDSFPYATINITNPITNGELMIDDDYNQSESSQLASKLSMGHFPIRLGITSFTQR